MSHQQQGSLFQSMNEDAIWTRVNSSLRITSPIDDILEQESFTLEDLLDEEELLQEVKAMNTKLIDFLCQKKTLETLIDYFTLPPTLEDSMSEEAVSRVVHKFPYVSCEVLCCNIYAIIQKIFQDDDLFARMFQILDCPSPIEARLAGYFHKVLCVFAVRNPDYVLLRCSSSPVDGASGGGNDQQGKPAAPPSDSGAPQDASAPIDAVPTPAASTPPVVVEAVPVDGAAASANVQSAAEGGAGAAAGGVIEAVPVTAAAEPPTLRVVFSTWLVDKLIRHLENYSVMCVFKLLLDIVLGQKDNESDSWDYIAGVNLVGDWGDDEKAKDEALNKMRGLWSGDEGCAIKVLRALEESENSDVHNNASDILADMLSRLISSGDNDASEDGNDAAGNPKAPTPSSAPATPPVPDWSVTLAEELMSVVLAPPRETARPSVVYNSASQSVAGLTVLTQLVGAFAREHWSYDTDAQVDTPREIKAILKHIPKLCDILRDGSEGQANQEDSIIRTQWGGTIVRLGMRRLKIIQLLCMLAHSKYPEVLMVLADCTSCALGAATDLFFAFEWNNVLHSVVETMIKFVITGGVSDTEMEETEARAYMEQQQMKQRQQLQFLSFQDKDSEEDVEPKETEEDKMKRRRAEQRTAHRMLKPVQDCLFNNVKIVSRLLDAYDRNGEALELAAQGHSDNVKADARHGQIGYMGFCHNIANATVELAKAEREEFRANGENGDVYNGFGRAATDNEQWMRFEQGELAEINIVERCLLGGEKPSRDLNSGMSDQFPSDGDLSGAAESFGSNVLDLDLEGGENTESVTVLDFGYKYKSYDDDSDEDEEDEDDDFMGSSGNAELGDQQFEGDLETWNPFQNFEQDNFYDDDKEGDNEPFEANFANAFEAGESPAPASAETNNDEAARSGDSGWIADFSNASFSGETEDVVNMGMNETGSEGDARAE